jgi:hypothetical protein
MSKKVLVPIFLLVLALVIVTGVVSAGSAVVYNHSDGLNCIFKVNDGVFSGPATIVYVDGTPEGKINMHCHATLQRGPASRTHNMPKFTFYMFDSGFISCKVQITKSGNANVSCPNQIGQLTPSW